jgi:hypothetical protein
MLPANSGEVFVRLRGFHARLRGLAVTMSVPRLIKHNEGGHGVLA